MQNREALVIGLRRAFIKEWRHRHPFIWMGPDGKIMKRIMTQIELAQYLEFSQGYFAQLMQGTRGIGGPYRIRLMRKLGVIDDDWSKLFLVRRSKKQNGG